MTTVNASVWQRANGTAVESVLQTRTTLFTSTFSSSANGTRIVVTDFFVDITPFYSNSRILVIASISVGFSSTPEWSWYVDRTIGGSTVQVGTAAVVGNRMNGYHGGPRDGNASEWTNEVESFSNTILDSPNTTSSCRYQICLQDKWSTGAKFINRSGFDGDVGYVTRGTSSITVMEIAQ